MRSNWLPELVKRSEEGPYIKETDFEMAIARKVPQLIKEYNIKFDPEVLGGNYNGHYGSGPVCTVTTEASAEAHPILAGIQVPFTSVSSLYKANPLTKSTKTLLVGSIPGENQEPIAWTNRYGKSRIFYTSLGNLGDFKNQRFRRFLINAVFWAMEKPVPKVKAVNKR